MSNLTPLDYPAIEADLDRLQTAAKRIHPNSLVKVMVYQGAYWYCLDATPLAPVGQIKLALEKIGAS